MAWRPKKPSLSFFFKNKPFSQAKKSQGKKLSERILKAIEALPRFASPEKAREYFKANQVVKFSAPITVQTNGLLGQNKDPKVWPLSHKEIAVIAALVNEGGKQFALIRQGDFLYSIGVAALCLADQQLIAEQLVA